MRNAKLGLFTMLAMITAGIGFTAAFEIQVGPQDYYGTLTLNRINIMKNYGLTGIVLDGTGYEISIASGGTPGYGKISVYQICGQGGGNCKQVSQLSTTTPVMNSITDNGLVEKTNGVANKVWKTNARGEPQWLDDATGSVSVTAYTAEPSWGNRTVDVIVVNGHTGKITLPNNPHYVGTIVAAASNSGTGNSTSNTTNTGTYLNYVENSTVKSHIQIKGSGSTTVSAKNGTITITSTGGGGGDSLWTESSDKTKIRQTDQTDAVVIGRHDGDLYESYIEFQGSGSYKTPGMCSPTTNYGGQVILYGTKMLIGHSNIITCSNDKVVEINPNGLGINAEADNTYALKVGGHAYINDSITASSATINGNSLQYNKVGIQKTTIDPSGEPLQVQGGIQISNYSSPTVNSDCTNGTIEYNSNKFFECVNGKRKINGGVEASNYSNPSKGNSCSPSGAIEYYNNKFFGCVNGVRGEFTVNTNTSQGMGTT